MSCILQLIAIPNPIIIEKLKESGVDVNYVNTKRREGDPAFLVADISKAKKILNWKPKYINIEETLKTAINWHQSHTN